MLADLGYEGENTRLTCPIKKTGDTVLTSDQRTINALHSATRALAERGNSLLKNAFKALRRVTLCPLAHRHDHRRSTGPAPPRAQPYNLINTQPPTGKGSAPKARSVRVFAVRYDALADRYDRGDLVVRGVMAHLVEIPVGDTVVLMSVTELDEGLVRAARAGKLVARTSRSLEDMLQGLRPVAESFVQQFSEMTRTPNEIRVEFGVTLSAEADMVIASTATEAAFSVSLMWSDRS